MTLNPNILKTRPGQLGLAALVLGVGVLALVRSRPAAKEAEMPRPAAVAAAPGPQTFRRGGARLEVPEKKPEEAPSRLTQLVASLRGQAPGISGLPISLVPVAAETKPKEATVVAPFGRMIPCETVVVIESNRLDTPVVGLVTEAVWSGGQVVVPAGAEVHGKAALDRSRERLAATGTWEIVWRDGSARNGNAVAVQGIALDRERAGSGPLDGSAGLRGEVVKTQDDRELRLFASTFLATSTGALQSTTGSAGLLGSMGVPAATARNATLAGTGAILREYADRMRAAIAADGFYLRIPAGKPFYLYVTQPIEVGEPRTLSKTQ